jgi:hypothetical protein
VADSLPRLFVFYTRNNYTKGNSCYNDYCPNGFAYAAGANHILHTALSARVAAGWRAVGHPHGIHVDRRQVVVPRSGA